MMPKWNRNENMERYYVSSKAIYASLYESILSIDIIHGEGGGLQLIKTTKSLTK